MFLDTSWCETLVWGYVIKEKLCSIHAQQKITLDEKISIALNAAKQEIWK
jgi:hypothetical protein